MYAATGDAAVQGAGRLPRRRTRRRCRTSTATATSAPRPTATGRRARPSTSRSPRGTSAPAGSTSTACGRPGTSSTRSSPACATPTASPATGRPSRSRSSFAAWAEGILSKLDDAQIQKMLGHRVRRHERGRWPTSTPTPATGDGWRLSDRFQHRAIVDPLARGEDILAGQARQHPGAEAHRLAGPLRLHRQRDRRRRRPKFFWDRVALHHSFATGGHGRNEYFGQPDRLSDMVDGPDAPRPATSTT